MNRDHSIIFETVFAPKYCILDSFVDYEGYSISSKGFLSTVVDIMVIWIKFAIPIYFTSLIPKMSLFSLAISCLTMSNLPWFLDLTLQVPMQYCSLQHQTSLSPADTSTTEYHFRFGPAASFFPEILVIALCPSLVAQMVRNLFAMLETWVWSLDQEDPLEKEAATHLNNLAWRIPWTEESGGLQSTGSQRVVHNWSDLAHTNACVGNHKRLWFPKI